MVQQSRDWNFRESRFGCGVGKYLKARNSQVESTTAVDSSLPVVSVTKKRKVGVSTGEYKDISSW